MLKRFPHVELSYDKTIHNKVRADLYTLVPKGEKAWLWFTYTGGKNACFLVRRNEVKLYTTCFADDLALGTVLSGTTFRHKQRTHFACDDVYHYEGFRVADRPLEERLALIATMFETQIKQVDMQTLTIGVMIMTTDYQELVQHADTVPYPVYAIRYRQANGQSLGMQLLQRKPALERTFKVTASLRDDVYFLDGELMAAIPSYKRSVAMNSIFRNIKENRNLDLLEESDGEDEFEDDRSDRFVDLKKSVLMRCVYHKRFDKWEPIEVVGKKMRR